MTHNSAASRTQTDSRVLLVCDVPELREVRASLLKRAGIGLTTAESIEAARRVWPYQPCDLILVDIRNSGQESTAEAFCSEVKEHDPSKLMAFISGRWAHGQSQCADAVIDGYDPASLIRRVHALLSSSEKA